MATGELDFTISFVNTPSFYRGAVVRTATGSGAGTQTAVGVRVVQRTATGSGTGTSTANYIEILPRSATGSGVGTSGGGASGLLTAIRSATGSGIGSSSTVFFSGKIRIATGSGIGSATTTFRREHFRSATDSGSGSQTGSGVQIVRASGTGSGTGSQSATHYKVFLFRPPTDNLVAYVEYNRDGLENRLFRFYQPEPRGRNVYKLTDGTFSENEQYDQSLVSITYHGGHVIPVTQAEKDDLVAAGYGAYVT